MLCAIFLAWCAVATAFAVDPRPAAPAMPAATMPVEPTLFRTGAGGGPVFDANVVQLLDGTEGAVNGLTLPAPSSATPASFEVRLSVRAEPGGEGFGLLLLPAGQDVPPIEEWDEPSADGAIGIGFDGRNPPNSTGDTADADGNIYDRPQREVSLHFDNREIFNRQSADFATGEPVPIIVRVRFVPGGAKMTVVVGGQTPTYDETLLAGVRPFSPKLAIGARAGAMRMKLDVRDVAIEAGPSLEMPIAEPRRVTLFDSVAFGLKSTREATTTIDIGDSSRGVARAIATLKIAAPSEGMDRLDRRGALYCYGPEGQRYELVRFRTPLGRPWQWTIDVTDFLPLLRDEAKFGLFIDTWGSGYVASVVIDFYPGVPERVPVAVVNLWQGEPILGDVSLPLSDFFRTRTVPIPPGATEARVRLTVTGHGQVPNTANAAEFLPLARMLWANDAAYRNVLWKTDNYLNPCRPQRGTWRTDRAGWGPGSVVDPWMIDVSSELGEGVDRTLKLDYAITDPYLNEHIGRGDPPTHWVDGQVIFYARQPRTGG